MSDTAAQGEDLIDRGIDALGNMFGPLGSGAADALQGEVDERRRRSGGSPLAWLPEGVRNFLQPILDFFSRIGSMIMGAFRGLVAKEEVAAKEGFDRQLNAGNSRAFFESIDQSIGIDGLGEEIREMVLESGDDFILGGLNMTTEAGEAVREAAALREDIYNHIINELKERNPNWTEADLERYRDAAERVASSVTGITGSNDLSDINPNNIREGYAGMLLGLQRGVAAEGQYVAAQVPQFAGMEEGIAEARAALSGAGVIGGQDSVPGAPGAPRDPSTPAIQ